MADSRIDKLSPGRLFRWKTRSALCAAALAVFALASTAPARAQNPIDPYTDVCYWLNLKEASIVDGFDFHAYKEGDSGKACFEIRLGSRTGQVLYRKTVESFGEFRLGQKADPVHDIPFIQDGTDLLGRGRPDMIVTTWSGGARCCFHHIVFELKPELKVAARIDDGDGDTAHFADLDGNGHYYYLGNDWTFAYWDPDSPDSFAPAIVLRFVDDDHGGSYHIAMDKMRTPEPTPEEWKQAVGEAGDSFTQEGGFGDGTGSKLWSNMVNLIYTGHSNLAWKLLDDTWLTPGQSQLQGLNKEKFLSDFCSQLKTSHYWPDIEKTLQEVPATCSAAKPRAAPK